MKTIACPSCGKPQMREKVIPAYRTRLGGVSVVVKDARVGVCDNCGESVVSAAELRRWREIHRLQLAQEGHTPTPAEVRKVREHLGLSVAQFASLLGVTRQAVHAWEKEGGPLMPLGPGALLVGMLKPASGDVASAVYTSLVSAAHDRGQLAELETPGRSPKNAATRSRLIRIGPDSIPRRRTGTHG